MSACRSCGKPIRWAVTQTGRKIPLDPRPVLDGNIVETAATDPEHGDPVVRVLARGEDHPAPRRYRSHFVSCPDAAQHRSRP